MLIAYNIFLIFENCSCLIGARYSMQRNTVAANRSVR